MPSRATMILLAIGFGGAPGASARPDQDGQRWLKFAIIIEHPLAWRLPWYLHGRSRVCIMAARPAHSTVREEDGFVSIRLVRAPVSQPVARKLRGVHRGPAGDGGGVPAVALSQRSAGRRRLAACRRSRAAWRCSPRLDCLPPAAGGRGTPPGA